MNRRTFLKRSSLASGLLLVPSFLKPLGSLNPMPLRRLVVVQLSGGNDWLNTVVPYGDDLYYRLRPRLGLKESQVLPLSNSQGLHAALLPLKELYDQGDMAIVNGVGYPNPDRSHFRSMDIWQSGSSSNEILHTGWLGRFLDNHCTQPQHAVEFDDFLSLALQGKHRKGMAIKNLPRLHRELRQDYLRAVIAAANGETLHEDNQGYLYKTLRETAAGTDYLFEKNQVTRQPGNYPNTALGQQLKDVAQLIGSGADTRVYYVSLSGFDTHAAQLQRHQALLGQYAEAMAAFAKHLQQLNQWDDTLVFTFSEFGRRVEENASAGTDHGTAGNVFLFGKKLSKKGLVNPASRLSQLDEGDLRYSVDFRSIYKDILQNWLQADADKIVPASVSPFRVV